MVRFRTQEAHAKFRFLRVRLLSPMLLLLLEWQGGGVFTIKKLARDAAREKEEKGDYFAD